MGTVTELRYFLNQIFIVVTVTKVTEVPQFLTFSGTVMEQSYFSKVTSPTLTENEVLYQPDRSSCSKSAELFERRGQASRAGKLARRRQLVPHTICSNFLAGGAWGVKVNVVCDQNRILYKILAPWQPQICNKKCGLPCHIWQLRTDRDYEAQWQFQQPIGHSFAHCWQVMKNESINCPNSLAPKVCNDQLRDKNAKSPFPYLVLALCYPFLLG